MKPLHQMLAPAEDHWGNILVCPECGGDYCHLGTPARIDSNDNYEAWAGRGDAITIPIDGECGHSWVILLGFHKGRSFASVHQTEARLV